VSQKSTTFCTPAKAEIIRKFESSFRRLGLRYDVLEVNQTRSGVVYALLILRGI